MASNQEHGALPLPALSPAPRVLIVAAPFYRKIANGLIAGARAVLDAAGAKHELIEVPGALEVPVAIRLAAESGAFEGYVALGCVIRGETTHYETICAESARGLMDLALTHSIALANGILTVENEAQAMARASVADKNKGREYAQTCLAMINLRRQFGVG